MKWLKSETWDEKTGTSLECTGFGEQNYERKLAPTENKNTLISFRKELTNNSCKRINRVSVHIVHPFNNGETLGWIEGEKIKNLLSL